MQDLSERRCAAPAPGRTALACLVAGLGLYWAWTFFSFNPPVEPAHPVALLHVTSMLGASVTFLLVALLRAKIAPLCARAGTLAACGALTAACTPAYMFAGPVALAVAASVLSGAAVAVVVCALAEAFVGMRPARLLAMTALSFLTAYVALLALGVLAQAVGRTAAVALASLMPLASATLPAVAWRLRARGAAAGPTGADAVPGKRRTEGREVARLPWRTLCVIASMYFAIGGIRVYVERVTGTLEMSAVGLVAGIALLSLAGVAAVCASRRESMSLGAFYKVAMPLVALAYVIMLTTGDEHPEALGLIAQTVCLLVEMLCWELIVDGARRFDVSALLIIGVGRFVVQLGMSLGELAGFAFAGASLQLGTVTVFLLVLSFVFLFSERETSVGAQEPAAAAGGPSDEAPAPQAEESPAPSALLADERGLTEREATVLDLWVTSHGIRSIGEALGLSESTVKTHVRHIYEKCGVHSKAELIELVDGLGGPRA